ncbi:MAG: DUF6678 family protein [Kiritimatiellia bacterium]|jgi:hypothetical protein|nr:MULTISPECIES: DUF6678 family protein [Pseudomonas]
MKTPPHLIPVMNNTKWDELRLAMYELEPAPAWRTKCWENGFVTPWDREWYYHFREGGYELTEWVEIRTESNEQRHSVLSVLDRVHVPTEEISDGFRVYGYIQPGQQIEYAKL